MRKLVIIGAGLVGLSLAHALKDSAYAITVLDSQSEPMVDLNDSNARSIALAYRSEKIFTAHNLWENLQAYTTPIKQIHISDRGHFGSTTLNAHELNVPALGYSIATQRIYHALLAALATAGINVLRPVKIIALDTASPSVTYEHRQECTVMNADLIVVACGSEPTLLTLLNIKQIEKDYQQTAIVANVSLSQPHRWIAYERFTNSGPIALLPIEKNKMALVWATSTSEAKELVELDDALFIHALQHAFGFRAGRFLSISKRSSYPLKLIVTPTMLNNKILIMGNTAHTLHPVSAQGFNLSVADIDYLAQQLKQHSLEVTLKNYLNNRYHPQQTAIRFTDTLINIFTNDYFPITPLRGFGLAILNNCNPLKNYLAKKVMGYYP